MSASIRIRNRRGELVDAPQVSASDAKNGFGRVLDRVAREGGVAITKHDETCAVLVSVEVFRALAGAESRTLNTLSGEFDALLERMQAPRAAAAMQEAFDMAPVQLGRAAVKHAAAQRRGKEATALAAARAAAARTRRTSTGAVAASTKGDTVTANGGVKKHARRARG